MSSFSHLFFSHSHIQATGQVNELEHVLPFFLKLDPFSERISSNYLLNPTQVKLLYVESAKLYNSSLENMKDWSCKEFLQKFMPVAYKNMILTTFHSLWDWRTQAWSLSWFHRCNTSTKFLQVMFFVCACVRMRDPPSFIEVFFNSKTPFSKVRHRVAYMWFPKSLF